MITAVLLNWKRPANVEEIIHSLEQHPQVTEIILWDNNPILDTCDRLLDLDSKKQPKLRRIASVPDLGLYTRFAAACLARNPYVLIQDDDILLPPDTITALLSECRNRSYLLHGIFGRDPKPDGSYGQDVKGDKECHIVLTRALVARRCMFGYFFADLNFFEDLQLNSQPYGNGEDIILALTTYKHTSGRTERHRVYNLPYQELPAPHAIHSRIGWGAHCAHRTRLLQRGAEYLKG